MSDPREVYEKLTGSFWIPTKQPPREQLAFSAAWDYQQLIIDQLEAKLVCYSDNALATMEQLQAEYNAYRETALVEADLLRKEE